MTVRARAPGRVNLMGDHTDYTGGLVLPAAIDRFVEIAGEPGGDHVVLHSDEFATTARVPIAVADASTLEPEWGRYVGGVVAAMRPAAGFVGTVTSTVPAGSGLSSSAALELATALALGASAHDPQALARLCQRAEHLARGVPTGIMDQLAVAAGRAGHALLIDCTSLEVVPVPLPGEIEIVVVHSGQARDLAASAYAERVGQCAAIEAEIGPLRSATRRDVDRLSDPVLRRRARHIVSENARVTGAVAALDAGDLDCFGRLMLASHASLRDDYEVSTAAMDDVVARLADTDGVFGARLTGAGFGGCVVAIARPGTAIAPDLEPWILHAVDGAHVIA